MYEQKTLQKRSKQRGRFISNRSLMFSDQIAQELKRKRGESIDLQTKTSNTLELNETELYKSKFNNSKHD